MKVGEALGILIFLLLFGSLLLRWTNSEMEKTTPSPVTPVNGPTISLDSINRQFGLPSATSVQVDLAIDEFKGRLVAGETRVLDVLATQEGFKVLLYDVANSAPLTDITVARSLRSGDTVRVEGRLRDYSPGRGVVLDGIAIVGR